MTSSRCYFHLKLKGEIMILHIKLHIYRPDAFMLSTGSWRKDIATARTIDQSLGVQSSHGTYHAAVLLHTKEVDISVALRVLAQRNQHRKDSSTNQSDGVCNAVLHRGIDELL
jgi:hypothetical protein